MWVEGGLIRAVGARLRTPPGTTEVDGTGDTLLPGLIDAHTHDWGESTKQALLFGVTTELNRPARQRSSPSRKRAEAEGKASDSATLFSAGNVVTPPKGHGTEYGLTVPTLTGAAEAQAFVDARIAEGSDYIKIILEDGRACGREFARLSNEELAAAVAAAHARGKLAIVHITTQEDARVAIAAGADGIAHVFADSAPRPDVIALLARRHAFAITTLTVTQSVLGTLSGPLLLADPRVAAAASPDAQAQMRKPMSMRCAGDLAYAFAAVRQMRDAGVPILAGTDAPGPRELERREPAPGARAAREGGPLAVRGAYRRDVRAREDVRLEGPRPDRPGPEGGPASRPRRSHPRHHVDEGHRRGVEGG